MKARACSSEHEAWSSCVYEQQFVKNLKGFQYFGFASFCVAEARSLTDGCDIIVGVKYDKVAGDSMKDKYACLKEMPSDSFMALVGHHGFFKKHCQRGELLLIPAGFIVLLGCGLANGEGEGGSCGVRWGIQGEKTSDKVTHECLEGLLSSFPKMKETDYERFCTYMGVEVGA